MNKKSVRKLYTYYFLSLISLYIFRNKNISAMNNQSREPWEIIYGDEGIKEENKIEGKTILVSDAREKQKMVAENEEQHATLLFLLEKEEKEYQKMCEQLEKIRELLPISPLEEVKYKDIKSIGDYVIPTNNCIDIYKTDEDLQKQENSFPSYFGTKEMRLIKGIKMAKEDLLFTAHTMEEYELLKEYGFAVIGYELVNQYSLQEEILKEEGKFREEDIKLVYKPKSKTSQKKGIPV